MTDLHTPSKPLPVLLTPLKAIRAKCLECCCGQTAEVRACRIVACVLHPYRMGHRPSALERKRQRATQI